MDLTFVEIIKKMILNGILHFLVFSCLSSRNFVNCRNENEQLIIEKITYLFYNINKRLSPKLSNYLLNSITNQCL